MSAPLNPSGRRSDRVEPTPENRDVEAAPGAVNAPECLSSVYDTRGPSRPNVRRTSRRRLERIDRDLSERERAVLQSVATLRLLSTAHLQQLHFADHRTEGAASRICRRVLARLSELRVIRPLERRVGGIRAGSASYVWTVGPIGERLLRNAAAIDGQPRLRHKEPSLRFVEHGLAVTSCYVEMVNAHRSGQIELLRWQAEPSAWRQFLGAHGVLETLKPDFMAVTAVGDFEDSWFIEIDRATESLPTVLKKCAQYQRYRQTGREQQTRDVFPAVVWVVPDEARAMVLAAGIRRSHELDTDLFRVVTDEAFAALIQGGAA